MTEQPIIKLHDGNTIPQLGLGVWRASIDEARNAMLTALNIGYRLIDTAAIYKNEEAIGQALQETDVPRDQIFITTKLWNDDQLNAERAIETSLKKMQLERADLYLMHWPCPGRDNYISAWKAMINLQREGLTKSIGVCNFNQLYLKRLMDETGITPVVNQIELHPMLQQRELHAWNALHQIQTESWSPLAQGGEGLFDHPIIKKLAKKYDKTAAQIVIRWHLDNGLIVIPKSVTASRIKENVDVFNFRLDKTEMSEISTLDRGKRLGPDPEELN